MKKHLAILFLLSTALLCGLWLGHATRPENFQLRGELTFDPTQVPSASYEVGDFIVWWQTENGGQLTVEANDRPGFILWQTIPGETFVMAARGNEAITENRGMFKIEDKLQEICNDQLITSFSERDSNSLKLEGILYCKNELSVTYSVHFKNDYPKVLSMSVHLENSDDEIISERINRLFLTYASERDEHFFGFGEQFTHFDLKGERVPIWVSEQGVGRGDQPITLGANITNDGAGGNKLTTYAPAAFYMTNKMHAFYLDNVTYNIFDLRQPDRVQIEIFWPPNRFPPTIWANIIDGNTPVDIVGIYPLSYKMFKLKYYEWAYSGAIVGMQGGTEKVRNVYSELKKRDTPIAAFWLQDWVGQRTTSFGKQLWWNWELDTDHYPNWEALVSDLSSDNIRILLYINPNLVDVSEKPNARRNLFKEAMDKGYLVKNSDGSPYLLTNTSFKYGMVDLNNEEARNWLENVIRENLLGIGASGWMADFGESMPVDASGSAGNGEFQHLIYPSQWADVSSDIALFPNVDNDTNYPSPLFFMRSASNGSHSSTPLLWEGDQMVSWDANDGIKSAVTGLNTSGLSGMAFNHSDIGGYTTITSPIKNYHRSRELLYRWMEMNAFTLIFRTHEGNLPENNVQLYTDDETLDTFAYWAKVYAALFDYRKQLVAEAVATGLPVVRHPFIHYPDDPETWKITYQEFMLGEDFLIAPVTDSGADEVEAYLPRGRWVHLWTGAVYGSEERGEYVTVPAPIGQPGVFYKEGSQAGEDFVHTLENQGLLP